MVKPSPEVLAAHAIAKVWVYKRRLSGRPIFLNRRVSQALLNTKQPSTHSADYILNAIARNKLNTTP